MPRVSLVKNRQEICDRLDQAYRGDRMDSSHNRLVPPGIGKMCHVVPPLKPFIHGFESYPQRKERVMRFVDHQERLAINAIHEQHERLLTSQTYKNIRLHPSELETLVPELRNVLPYHPHLDLIPVPWLAESLQCTPFSGAVRSPLEGSVPPSFSTSSTSPAKSALSKDSAAASGSKFNPFAKCEPLTADVDTNRLYPRINRSTAASNNCRTTYTIQQSAQLSPSHQTALATHCGRSFSTPLDSSYGLFKSSRVVDYFAGLMFDRRRSTFDFTSKTVTDLPSGTDAALALDAGIRNYARSLIEHRAGENRNASVEGNQLQQQHQQHNRDAVTSSATVEKTKTAIRVSINRYRCTECPKSYSTVGGLSKHRQFCRRQSTIPTSVTQSSAPTTVKHVATAASKDQRCPQCDKSYTSSSALKMHIRTHTLPCRCRLCGKAFSRPWLLQGHLRTHTGEKPFECPHCSRAFADRSNLRAHLQTHYDVKQYNCTVCRRTFSRMSLLLKHRYGPCSNSTSVTTLQRALKTGTATGNDDIRDRLGR